MNKIDEKLFIIIVRHNNIIIGIAPFHINLTKGILIKKRVLQFFCKADYLDILIDPLSNVKQSNIISKIFDAVFDNEKEWDEINLTHINHSSPLTHFILQRKYNENLEYLVENPFIDFSNYKDYVSYSKDFTPKKINQYINSLNNKLNYRIITTNENVVKSISKVHISQKNYLNKKNKNYKRHSHFENKNYFNFINNLSTNNKNILTYLLVDSDEEDEIICYFSGFVFKNIFHSVSTAVNPKYNYLSMGRIFNYLIFKQNFTYRNWDIFDMGTGRYEWKFELTNTFNLLYVFHYENYKSWQIKILNKIEKILRATKKIIVK